MIHKYNEIYKLFKEGKHEEARAVQHKVNAIVNCIIANRVIPATKYMCKMMGCDVGEARFPQRHRAGGTKLSSAAERPSKAGTQSVQWSDSGKASARRVGPRLCGFCKKEGTSGTAVSSLENWWRIGKVR